MLVLSLTGGGVGAIPAALAQQSPSGPASVAPPLPPRSELAHPSVTASTDDAGGAPAAAESTVIRAELSRHLRPLRAQQPTIVEIVTTTATADEQLAAIGATAISSIGGITLASLTPAQVAAIAGQPGVQEVRLPVDLRAASLSSPAAPPRTPSAPSIGPVEWGQPGYDGAGVKVGIIDIFDPAVLSTQMSQGQLPSIPANQQACWWAGQACPFGLPGYTHGNSVAELVIDGAPGVALYLAEVGTLNDYLLAINWFAANGVTVVNHSQVGPYDGPGDGTGGAAAIIDYAVSKGIAWVNAAGNANPDPQYPSFQGGYWRGTWNDPDNDSWLNFSGTDESLTSYCGALLGLRWSDWGAARTDYDLYVSDYSVSSRTNGSKKLASGFNQAAGIAPVEANDMRWLCNTNASAGPVYDTNRDGFVSLWVFRTTRSAASPVGDVLEIMVNQGWLEHSSSAGSAAIPFGDSRNPGAASVGAHRTYVGAAPYSARGPTNDGRAKPDFAINGCTSTSVDGSDSTCQSQGFSGTSAAAPQVAALVARGAGTFGFRRPADMVSWVRSFAQPDTGSIGTVPKDNNVGWGVPWPTVVPRQPDLGSGFVSRPPLRLLDTRGVNGQPLGAAIGMRPPDSIVMLNTGYIAGTSVMLNITLVYAASPGFLQVYPFGSGSPGATSNLNATAASQNRANLAIVTVGVDGQIGLYTSGGGHILVDLVGSFRNSEGNPLTFLEPYEAFDSATCSGCSGAPVAGGSYIDVPLVGTTAHFDPSVGVPTNINGSPVSAVAISVTVRNPSGKGYLSVVGTDTTVFGTSNMNFDPGETLTVTTFAPVDGTTRPSARIFTSQSAHVRVDVLGYVGPKIAGDTSGYFTGISTVRVADSRVGARPAAGATVVTPLLGQFGLPEEYMGGVFVNSTSTQAVAAGSVATGAFAGDDEYRTLSMAANRNVAAGSVALLDDSGALRMKTSASSHLIADVAGWFTGPSAPMPAGSLEVVAAGLPINGAAPAAFAISDDGSVVAWRSGGSLFTWQRTTGAVTQVMSGLTSRTLALTGDGSTLFFTTTSSLLPTDTDATYDIYALRLSDLALSLESLGVGGAEIERWVQNDGVSDDGQTIVFRTDEQLVPTDTDDLIDLYLRHRGTGAISLLSTMGPASYSVTAGSINGAATTAILSLAGTTPQGQYDRPIYTVNLASGVATNYAPWLTLYEGAEFTDVSDDATVALTDEYPPLKLIPSYIESDLVDLQFTPTSEEGDEVNGAMSGDGRYFVGTKEYLTLIGLGPLPEHRSAILYDRSTGSLTQILKTWNGAPLNARVSDVVVSDDGRYALVATTATNATSTPSSGTSLYLVDLSLL